MTDQDPRTAFAADLRRHAAVVATESIDSGLGDDDTFDAVTASCLMYAHYELTVGDLRSVVDLGIADALAADHLNVLA